MKTVAHLIHYDGPGGGPQTVIEQLALAKERFNLKVFHGGWGLLANYCKKKGIPHTKIPLERKVKIPIGFLSLTWHLFRLQPDALVLHGQWAGLIGAIAGRLVGIKAMIYITQFPSFYTDWDLFRIFRNHIVERITCHIANRIIPLSEGNKYQFLIRRLAPDEKFTVVNNSFDPARVPGIETIRKVREKHGWSNEECHVVSVGRLADQKRVDWLLKSWKIVKEQHLPAHLWIIGDGPDEGSLKKLSQGLRLGDTCHFLGPCKGIDYIAAADIVAMTTIYEGHANVPMEAMGCGKPIVANDVDGVRDSFANGVEGFLVPPADIPGFARCLIELINNPTLREVMGTRGLERAKTFHPAIKIKQLLDIIEQLIINKNAPI